MKEKNVIFIMGVSGSGKSTVAELLSPLISASYVDADDVHPTENVLKMSKGIPLTDCDRRPWLETLNNMAIACIEKSESIVFACSCLTPEYRKMLQKGIQDNVLFVYLKGDFETISNQLSMRSDHYFSGNEMLKSQFDALVEPNDNEDITYLEIDIERFSAEEIAQFVSQSFEEKCYA